MTWFSPHAERPWKGISFAVLDEAGVTCEDGLVRVPYRASDGSELNAKVFAPSGRTWWETAGEELIPFGLEAVPELEADVVDDVALIVCEGESDALAVREAFAGTLPDALVRAYRVLGLPGANTWRQEWRRWLSPFARLYVVGDGDPSGRRMTDAVLADVPWARPVFLPEGEDARSILQRDGSRGLDRFLDVADYRARLWYGLRRAGSIDELEAILAGDLATIERVRRAA